MYMFNLLWILGHYSVVSYENVHLPTGRPDFPDGNRGKLSVFNITYFFASNKTDNINLLSIYIIVYSFSRNCGRYDQRNQPLLCLHSLHVCLRHTNHAMDCSPHLALLLLHDCLDHSMRSNVLWIIGWIFYSLLCSRNEGASVFGMKSWLNWCFQITNDRILRFNVKGFTFFVFTIQIFPKIRLKMVAFLIIKFLAFFQ